MNRTDTGPWARNLAIPGAVAVLLSFMACAGHRATSTAGAAPVVELEPLESPAGQSGQGPRKRRARQGGFEGHLKRGSAVPDCPLAVGHRRVVTAVNWEIQTYTRTGVVERRESFEDFFAGHFDGRTAFDPVLVFDPHSEHFFLLVATRSPDLIAISVMDDADPRGEWRTFVFDVAGFGRETDFPDLGVGPDAVHVFFRMEEGFQRSKVIAFFDKAAMLSGQAPAWSSLVLATGFNTHSQTIATVKTYDTDTPAQYFAWLRNQGPSGTNRIQLEAIRDPLGTPLRDTFMLDIPLWSWLDSVPQAGSATSVSNEPAHYLKHGVLRDGTLWLCHSVGKPPLNDRAVVRWYEVEMNGWPVTGAVPSLREMGEIDAGTTAGGAPISTIYPSLDVDEAGTLGLTYHRVSAAELLTLVHAQHRATDPPGVLSTRVDWATSTRPVPAHGRFGDYTATQADPAVPGSFWGHGELRIGGGWQTWIGRQP